MFGVDECEHGRDSLQAWQVRGLARTFRLAIHILVREANREYAQELRNFGTRVVKLRAKQLLYGYLCTLCNSKNLRGANTGPSIPQRLAMQMRILYKNNQPSPYESFHSLQAGNLLELLGGQIHGLGIVDLIRGCIFQPPERPVYCRIESMRLRSS